MTIEIFTLIAVLGSFVAVAAVRWFRTLDGNFLHAARLPLIAGVVSGIAIRFFAESPYRFVIAAVLLTIAALYVRLMGEETEAADGMLLGALTGATAALPLIIDGHDVAVRAAECMLAGSIAGYGITFAVFHVADRARQIVFDVMTAAAAIGLAWLPGLILERAATDPRNLVLASIFAAPLIAFIGAFRQSRNVRAELRHEASLGFMDDGDVRSTAHPLLRLGRAGWVDPGAHREFVHLATKVALRKRQQRERTGEIARLYQLEIIKLRMQMQEMANIDRALRARLQGGGDDRPSDTMASS